MEVKQISLTSIQIDKKTYDVASIKYSTQILPELDSIIAKQEKAVQSAKIMAEAASNKLVVLKKFRDRVSLLPEGFKPSIDLKNEDLVKIYCNLGDDTTPIYKEFEVTFEESLLLLKKNPSWEYLDETLNMEYAEYLNV